MAQDWAAALTAWMRKAKPSKSYGALPPPLQTFVASVGLSELRVLVPKELGDRVACIKRREQNQRAQDSRKAARNKELEDVRHQLHLYKAQCKLLSAYTRAMTEYAGHLLREDGDALFGPGAQAAYLFTDVHARPHRDHNAQGLAKRRRVFREAPGEGGRRHDESRSADSASDLAGGFVPPEAEFFFDDNVLAEGLLQGGNVGGAIVGGR